MGTIIPFDNVYNVRDFGGHETTNGARVKERLLFRGAQLSQMNDVDREKFSNHDINLVIDLRYLAERKKQPSAWGETLNPVIVNYDDSVSPHQNAQHAPHEAFMINDLFKPQDAHGYMMGSYKDRPLEPGFLSAAKIGFKTMIETGDATYIHCAAGKDRTGTYCALILMALGVDEKTVMEEYMMTLQAVDIEPILTMVSKRMTRDLERDYSPDLLRPFFTVAPDYLQSSLDVIGDIGEYWTETLEFDSADLRQLRERYLQS